MPSTATVERTKSGSSSMSGGSGVGVLKPRTAPSFPRNSARSASPRSPRSPKAHVSPRSSPRTNHSTESIPTDHTETKTDANVNVNANAAPEKRLLRKTKSDQVYLSEAASKLPTIPSLDVELELEAEAEPEEETNFNTSLGMIQLDRQKLQTNTNLEEDETIFSQEDTLVLLSNNQQSLTLQDTKDHPHKLSKTFPLDQWIHAADTPPVPTTTTTTTTDQLIDKQIPPKQRSKGSRTGRKPSPSPFQRSNTGTAPPSIRRRQSPGPPLQRSKTDEPPHTSRHQPSDFKGRAESILNHPLLTDSDTHLDMSMSMTMSINFDAPPLDTPTRMSPTINDHSHSSLTNRRRGRSSATKNSPAIHSAKQRKQRSSLNGSNSKLDGSSKSTLKDASEPRQTRHKDAHEKLRDNTERRVRSLSRHKENTEDKQTTIETTNNGSRRSRPSSDRQANKSAPTSRRPRSRTRPDTDQPKNETTDTGTQSIANIKEVLKKANDDVSHTPTKQPRGRPAGNKFPTDESRATTARSVPPARNRAAAGANRHRHKSPSSEDGSTHRSRSASPINRGGPRPLSTGPPKQASGERPNATSNPSQSSSHRHSAPRHTQSHRQTRKPITREENETSPAPSPISDPTTNTTNDHDIERKEPRMSLANVFDLAIKNKLSGEDSDDSSAQSAANKTVLQFDPTNTRGSVSSFKRAPDDPDASKGVFKMEHLKTKQELQDSEHGPNEKKNYLPGNMQPTKSQESGRGDDGSNTGRRRRTSRRHSKGRPERSQSRDGSISAGPKRGEEGSVPRRPRRKSHRRRDSLRMEDVFDLNKSESNMEGRRGRPGKQKRRILKDETDKELNKSESNLENSHSSARRGRRRSLLTNNGGHESASSFSGSESDLRNRRARLRQRRLREQDHMLPAHSPATGVDEESEEESLYLPSAMRSVSPTRRVPARMPAQVQSQAQLGDEHSLGYSSDLVSESDDGGEDDDSTARRSSALSYVKKQLKKQFHSASNSTVSDSEGEESLDPYNKKAGARSDSKSVSKKIKGLFSSKSKKHRQMLGGNSSGSDLSGDM